MIETIDEITADDLFNALGDSDFARKLHDATERRVQHHNNWLENHKKTDRKEGVSREFKKTKNYMGLRTAILKLI